MKFEIHYGTGDPDDPEDFFVVEADDLEEVRRKANGGLSERGRTATDPSIWSREIS